VLRVVGGVFYGLGNASSEDPEMARAAEETSETASDKQRTPLTMLLVCLEDRKLHGVHVFGTGATELVHIGQAVMGCGGTIDYLVDAVFKPRLCIGGLRRPPGSRNAAGTRGPGRLVRLPG
jgi:Pyridine nucleotide-disulphide oxidoreductase, dimerisation domain